MKTVEQAIEEVLHAKNAFCKFLSANDTGETGGHQAGIYIPKNSISLIFDEPGLKGSNKERWADIEWPEGNITHTRFIYYGKSTRNEYRITNFGRGFPYLKPEFTGALFVLINSDDEHYTGYVLNTDLEIDKFLNTFGLSPADTNKLIETGSSEHLKPVSNPEQIEKDEINSFIHSLTIDFPASEEMSRAARQIQTNAWDHADYEISNPDKKLIDWTNTEFRLFQALENDRFSDRIHEDFERVDQFVALANSILNRRKSRAGKSLEHHLSALFVSNNLSFTAQGKTEGHKKPDFIFPSEEAYHNPDFPVEKLAVLGAKTTCKDRWRQVINEADRLRDRPKFLCTLQQGISSAQMDEMKAEQVILVVPEEYISAFPKEKRDQIWTVKRFINYIHSLEQSDD